MDGVSIAVRQGETLGIVGLGTIGKKVARLARAFGMKIVYFDVRRLTATAGTNVYRLRVGDWRAAFLLRARAVEVIRVFHRSEGYGWLERLYP